MSSWAQDVLAGASRELVPLVAMIGGGWLIHLHPDMLSSILPLMATVVTWSVGKTNGNGNGK